MSFNIVCTYVGIVILSENSIGREPVSSSENFSGSASFKNAKAPSQRVEIHINSDKRSWELPSAERH